MGYCHADTGEETMSTLQLASDATNRVIVEWNKYPPHFRIIADGLERAYHTESAALRAAQRLCRKHGLELVHELEKADQA